MAEIKERIIGAKQQEMEGRITEVQGTELRLPPEVKTWMRKVEEDPMQPKSIANDDGQPQLQPMAPQNPKIQLPVTRSTFALGFKNPVSEAGRWLSAFILRLIKIKQGEVKFKEE